MTLLNNGIGPKCLSSLQAIVVFLAKINKLELVNSIRADYSRADKTFCIRRWHPTHHSVRGITL